MSKDDQQPIDSLEEEYIEPSGSITSEKSSSGNHQQTSDTNAPNLENIRTAGF